jgi:molybdenum-dependent DNA-binding transcriptional regulator ModE
MARAFIERFEKMEKDVENVLESAERDLKIFLKDNEKKILI